MASTSSMASSSSDFPSTSASKEIIPDDEENTKQTQNTVNPKVNGIENGEKPASKSLSKDPINKKPPTFPNPFKCKAKKLKPEKPTIENSPNPEEEARKKEEETKKEIEAISNLIRADLDSIKNTSKRVEEHKKTLKEATEKFKKLRDANASAKDFREFKKVVKTLKQQISTQDKVDPKQGEALDSQVRGISTANAQVDNAVQLGKMPNLFTDSDFERTLQFRDFKARYNELNFELKLCLLCFSVFPEDVEIKRRVMIYWWIGEEFVSPRNVLSRPEESSNQQHWDKFDLRKINLSETDLTPEHWANFYFDVLLKMGFIESAQKKPNPKVDVCKMHPFVRSMLNRIAQKAEFFEFDDDGTVNKKFSKSLRACLVHEKELTEDKKKEENKEEKKKEDKKKETELLGKFCKSLRACLVLKKESTEDKKKEEKKKETELLGKFSKSLRACLVLKKESTEDKKKEEKKKEDKKKEEKREDKKKEEKKKEDMGKIHAIFNVDEAILDSKHDSLSNMRNANVLYLGRWQNLGTHHIEIDDTKILNAKSGNILDGLQNIKNLKFLSLQGISRITKLPKSILKLKNLTILDIRACHDLKKILDDIGCLVNLTHLDMSECYLLDDLPKGISLLTKLQVLSGFVVVESENKNSCTLEDLKGFHYLRKLSMRTGSDKFPMEKDLQTLNQFKALNKLTIAWGRRSQEAQRPEQKQGLSKKIGNLKKKLLRRPEHTLSGNSSLSQLTKLDLQCLPEKSPKWLRPEKLLGLKKLYIRGGNLFDLGQFQGFSKDENGVVVGLDQRKWENVEELRLKYMDELDMEWRELLELFPKLDYLEKENCPKLSFFPCNEIGVWRKKKTIS